MGIKNNPANKNYPNPYQSRLYKSIHGHAKNHSQKLASSTQNAKHEAGYAERKLASQEQKKKPGLPQSPQPKGSARVEYQNRFFSPIPEIRSHYAQMPKFNSYQSPERGSCNSQSQGNGVGSVQTYTLESSSNIGPQK